MKTIAALFAVIVLFVSTFTSSASASYNASKPQTEVKVLPTDSGAVTPVVEVVATPAISNEKPVYDYSSAVDSYKYSYARLSPSDWISLHYEAIMTCAVTSAVFLVIIGFILLYYSKKLLNLEKKSIHIQSMLEELDVDLNALKLDSAINRVATVIEGKVIPF